MNARIRARALALCAFATCLLLVSFAFAQGAAAAPSFDLLTLLGLISGHQWLPLAIAVAAYVRVLLSERSRFPLSVSAKWLPSVTALCGLGFGVLVTRQNGASWQDATISGFITAGGAGLFDGVLTAAYGNAANAPAWARWIVGIVDDVTKDGGGGGASASKPALAAVSPPAPKPPTAARLIGALAVAALVGLMGFAPRPTLSAGAMVGEAAATASGQGCSWLKSSPTTVPNQAAGELACVGSQLLNGTPTLDGMLKACGPLALSAIFADAQSLWGYYATSASDGGTVVALRGASAEVCGDASSPPYPGAPACISAANFSWLSHAVGK